MADKNTNKTILVYADWQGMHGAELLGILNAIRVRGNEVFSFEYAENRVRIGNNQILDPDLQFFPGKQYLQEDKPNFGIFLDSSPDRWGRVLMKRREAVIARKEERKPNLLFESDFLLGVYDGYRIGALRFKTAADGAFLNNQPELAAPPMAYLRELENASLQLERDEMHNDEERLKWLNMLIAPGSSLGGARPKAGVKDEHGHLWIAKFPSINDEMDIAAWEMVVYDLAVAAGINVPPAMLKRFSGKHHTFITKRFDRAADGSRIHFASAMTLLGYNDGAGHQRGVSYLELVGFLVQHGAKVDECLEELWRRIVFNICVKNTDDHLRNHGFLMTQNGWELSPAYDVNPVPGGSGLTLNISDNDNSLEMGLAMEVAPYFRLTEQRATDIMDKVKNVAKHWRKVATKYKISKTAQDEMAGAFWGEKNY